MKDSKYGSSCDTWRYLLTSNKNLISMAIAQFSPDDKSIEVRADETLLAASLRSRIPHVHACGGKALCSTCRVLIVEGLEYCCEPNAKEAAIAKALRLGPSVRLACQTTVRGNVRLRRLVVDNEDIQLVKESKESPGVGPVGETKRLAILFADIRGFTPFAEALSAYDVMHVLNRYFRRMEKAIVRNGGCINAFIGDGLMALFGVEDPMAASLRAVRAALEMLQEMEDLNPYIQMMYGRTLRIGIGIHYGDVVVGTVGVGANQKVTAIGDAVNLASRIEQANKPAGTQMLISENTYEEVKNQIRVRTCCTAVTLPGKSGQYTLHEVLGLAL